MNPFKNIKHTEYRKHNGLLEAVQVLEETVYETSAGPLVPVYKTEDFGRKKLMPVRFDKYGNIRSIPLQDAVNIKTSCGTFSAELLTFYPGGELCRLFPLNGKLSGYWSETNEYELAETVKIPTSVGDLEVKLLYLHFYETGELKSVTFWPREKAVITTPVGKMKIRRGVSFHPDGSLASCEPSEPVEIQTPFGKVNAFDPDPNGMNGEKNSLQFDTKGNIAAFATNQAEFKVSDPEYGDLLFQPDLTHSMCSDLVMVRQGLFVELEEEHVLFRSMSGVIGRTSRSNTIEMIKLDPAPVSAPVPSCSL